ncbi:hypothetical protein CcaverHIS002_0200380 [Cutaneotrichosporon cavernicola]|uniref:Uncharacterized protein n=1 Tax=Cutaneotrichosporon cavernicola TaxID=279322 RepID=A0AA48I7U4_9TREE|nr:uncharacterized protein CcaverHIS019_0200420 [Cutaneotrichosporon cavernicola]BEI80878.1 hypothetical protein CcaverHIS002_0200380 [Cutaneotrichosporon cavernicola]BEI88680.1 hypothetical protein CcaverHIS019_0200420 [Cutaneotrichosporon cavernicola]BEI96453.1 hypothetical protein CcaverHIS631_0200420 [Cutaneotrichosporon cavernicola]BEJ04226.1 hypothetical protein CcaverHIS641_0200430 [Cutaneotrichosporon cavernicola]
MVAFTTLAAATVLAMAADAHISGWHPSMFGFDYPNQSNYPYKTAGPAPNYNNNRPVTPIRLSAKPSENFWVSNGLRDYPPAPGQFLDLPTGGATRFEVSCNRAYTSFRHPGMTNPLPPYACTDEYPLHTVNWFNKQPDISKLGGAALAIAYTSDAKNVKGSDFTVVSVQYRAVWERVITFNIPSGMPECPPEGCLCTWNWLHTALNTRNPPAPAGQPQGEGYGFEIFNTLFRCKVSGGVNNNNKVGAGQNPVECSKDSSQCVKGPKKPIITWMASGNTVNMNNDERYGYPVYNKGYGFANGAQQDAVVPK